MDYRPLGRTRVQVSKLCLGTMMFGAWGNTDHDDSTRIIHRALDAGVNLCQISGPERGASATPGRASGGPSRIRSGGRPQGPSRLFNSPSLAPR